MSHFYGTVKGNRKRTTRCGTKKSGMETFCASWDGAVRCQAYIDKETGLDCIMVEKTTWCGEGEYRKLFKGLIGQPEKQIKKHKKQIKEQEQIKEEKKTKKKKKAKTKGDKK